MKRVMTNKPHVLDGVAIASEIKAEVGLEVSKLLEQGIRPGLAVILVGNVAASEIYVRSKVKTCGELGIFSELITPPESVTTDEMLEEVEATLLGDGSVRVNDILVIISGAPMWVTGTTNLMKLHRVGERR